MTPGMDFRVMSWFIVNQQMNTRSVGLIIIITNGIFFAVKPSEKIGNGDILTTKLIFMNKKNDLIIIEAKFIRETPKSLYLDCEGDPEWFPKSQVKFDAEKNELTLPKWLAKKTFPNEQ